MIDTIYVEEGVATHPLTESILGRFRDAVTVPVTRYGEVFNRNHQSLRLQKAKPSLILAEKLGNQVLPAPEGYGIGSGKNFYFSHVLNCLCDCRYCFLQGMYRSAHYVLFVNYEDFQETIASTLDADPDQDVYFFSGYDGDSLALDAITGFVDSFVPLFARHPRAFLELQTKSATIRSLLQHEPGDNVVVAFSFAPNAAGKALEHGVPPLEARVSAMQKLTERGYRLGLRFDPLLYTTGYREQYQELFEAIFPRLEIASLHSVSFGPFRVPRDYFQRMAKLYPEERLFAGIEPSGPMVSYPPELEAEMRSYCEAELKLFVPAEILFPCRV